MVFILKIKRMLLILSQYLYMYYFIQNQKNFKKKTLQWKFLKLKYILDSIITLINIKVIKNMTSSVNKKN